MGLEQLPNGMPYFSISEELQIWSNALIQTLTPVNVGILTILIVIAVGIVISLTLYQIKASLEFMT